MYRNYPQILRNFKCKKYLKELLLRGFLDMQNFDYHPCHLTCQSLIVAPGCHHVTGWLVGTFIGILFDVDTTGSFVTTRLLFCLVFNEHVYLTL